eukprot:scaffold29684_cov76-Amphora_coffeaeformis.AAC.1
MVPGAFSGSNKVIVSNGCRGRRSPFRIARDCVAAKTHGRYSGLGTQEIEFFRPITGTNNNDSRRLAQDQ